MAKIQVYYAGNYDFWYESSQLLIRQMKEVTKKGRKDQRVAGLYFRFSANASKSKTGNFLKRALEKIQLDDIQPSSRKYPYINFTPNRSIGNEVPLTD